MQMWLTHVLPRDYPVTNTEIERYNGYRITWEFMDTFQPGDERLDAIVTEYTSTDGTVYNRENPGSTNERLQLGAIPRKYGEDPEQIGEGSGIDWIVFRYADVILMKCEAITRGGNATNGDTPMSLFNQIRAYVNAPLLDHNPSLQEILDERGREFLDEHWRRNDLIRFGDFERDWGFKYDFNPDAGNPQYRLWPLSVNVLNTNTNWEQNAGYNRN